MIESFKNRLSDSINWVVSTATVSPNSHVETMSDTLGDKDSLFWSSDDAKSFELSTTNEFEENYFTCPVDDSLLQAPSEIEEAIEQVKALVLETDGVSEDRIKLVKRLVALRLRLEDVKEIQDEKGTSSDEEFRIVICHHFLIQNQIVHRTPQYCDRCGGIIWTVIQHWYRCKSCAYQCHTKCLNTVVRKCPIFKVCNETEYITAICPEVGLPDQNYQCFECKIRFTLRHSWMEPRRCDYNGRYYCPLCHKNNVTSIPARILHNWDFEEKPISEESRQFLSLMVKKPNMHLDKINPRLFGFVEELNAVKKLREDIMTMKEFFLTCRNAVAQKLLRKLDDKQHFVESSSMYSLQDLIDVNCGTMLKFLEKIHTSYLDHIKKDCEICKGKGFICEICKNIQVIFPFDSATHQCSLCHALFHNICFAKRESCPKCLRLSRRASIKAQ